MTRPDMVGFFWNDTPPPKPPKKTKPKRIPPEPIWLLPTYLPGLEEARNMKLNLFTDEELILAQHNGEQLAWDIECYPNYFLVAFKSIQSGKIIYFEMDDNLDAMDLDKLQWILARFCLVDYNGNGYDVPIISIAAQGFGCQALFEATEKIIVYQQRPQDVLKYFGCKRLQINHIDLIELVALSPSLKLLSGRVHARRMQDLPFAPGSVLSYDQTIITLWYCVNDLDNTIAVRNELLPDIQLREKMGVRYGIDLRSKSDAQIAEAIIATEIKKLTGLKYVQQPKVNPEAAYKYQIPHFIKYQTPLLNWVLDTVKNSWFTLHPNGSVIMPKELEALKITVANGIYRMGIGGLHSSEEIAAHFADENTILCDRDVASYYPKIILNCGLAPVHLGKNFLKVYGGIVNERLVAKEAKNKVVADSLKIVVNGSFGKLDNMYSVLYSPDLLIQVTITGQLSLLMLIEQFELAGIPVVSANTDGAVIKCPKHLENTMNAIVAQWERETGFETEETRYLALLSRDVNNYFAVKQKWNKDTKSWIENEQDGCKVKGIYSELGSSRNSILSKNPTSLICSDAIIAFLTTGKPIAATIRGSQDIRRFVCVRTVKGGAVKDGQYLGKAIRWYYAAGQEGEIIYAKTGNKVPRSEGAKPLMQLPDTFPNDIDYHWYEKEAHKILIEIGYLKEDLDTKEVEEKD